MKRIGVILVFIFVAVWLVFGVRYINKLATAANKINIEKCDSTAYYKAKCDTLTFLVSQYETFLIGYENQLRESRDSISRLNKRPVMTEAQFIQLYKYDRLLKYYKICKKNPSQWKYYKGWSSRVFEQ